MQTALEQALREAIRQAIEGGRNRHDIAKAAGVNWSQVQRFVDFERTVSATTAGKLADALRLELRQKKSRKSRRNEVDT